MRQNTFRLIWSVTVVAVWFGCAKKDTATSPTEGATDENVSGASGAWRNKAPEDTTPPEKGSFWGEAGSSLGSIKLHLVYPEEKGDYAKIEMRRAQGSTTPTDDCTGGTVAKTITDFTVDNWEDSGLYPAETYSYRACIYDAAGNVISANGETKAAAASKQRFFITSAKFDGNFSAAYQSKNFTTGLEGADYRCQYLATAGGLTGTWKAVLSSGSLVAASSHVPVFGKIYNLATTPELLAETKAELWGGRLEHAVKYNETGTAVAANEWVWTGSASSGAAGGDGYTCQAWTASSSSAYGYIGDPNALAELGDWSLRYVNTCNHSYRLYCIEAYTPTVTAPTITATADASGAKIDLAVAFPSDVSAYGSVRILRQPGKALTNPTCQETYADVKLIKLESESDTDAFVAKTISDASLLDGYYTYQACVYDHSGNLVSTSTTETVTLGTAFKSTFVTSQMYDGNLGGLSGANTKCQTLATAAGLSGTWKAFLAANSSNVSANVGTFTANVYDLAGNYLGAGYSGVASYSVGTNAISTDETGTAVAADTDVWTGSYTYGSYGSSHCSSWTTNASGSSGYYGRTRYAYGWLSYSTDTCDKTKRLICLN